MACPISPCSEQASPPVKPTISGMECTRQCGEGQRKASHYHFSCLHNITHKATYLSLLFVHFLCAQSHLLSCHVITQKAAYCHLTFSKFLHTNHLPSLHFLLHANTHKGSYCDFDFSMLIHKKPITVVASISLFYHTQSHLPSLHFLCVFNTAQTPIMSYQFSPCFYTQSCLLSLHSMFYTHKATHYHLTPCFLYIQSHLLSLCSCFIHTNPLTITSLHVLYTQSHFLPFYFLHPFFFFCT